MRIIAFAIVFCFLGLNLPGQELVKNLGETKIDFKIKNIGVYVKGNFDNAQISGNFDRNDLESSFINALINISSINTGNTKRDAHLLKADFFNEAVYKQIKLVSTKIEKVSGNNYILRGKLTIKKTTKTIVIPMNVSENDDLLKMKGNFDINRSDYNVGGSSWILSNTVKISIEHTIKK